MIGNFSSISKLRGQANTETTVEGAGRKGQNFKTKREDFSIKISGMELVLYKTFKTHVYLYKKSIKIFCLNIYFNTHN